MYVCICNGVTDAEIRSAVERGAQSLDCLRDELGVASCCGTCACAAQELLDAGHGNQAVGGRSMPSAAAVCAAGATPGEAVT
jgi:bacterioferritin-associated ferredoxin